MCTRYIELNANIKPPGGGPQCLTIWKVAAHKTTNKHDCSSHKVEKEKTCQEILDLSYFGKE